MPLFLAGQSHDGVALSGGGSGGRPLFERLQNCRERFKLQAMDDEKISGDVGRVIHSVQGD